MQAPDTDYTVTSFGPAREGVCVNQILQVLTTLIEGGVYTSDLRANGFAGVCRVSNQYSIIAEREYGLSPELYCIGSAPQGEFVAQ